ncbi:hypothetical protein V6N12_061827 [Hibiscus sabdariffa]|uniref:Uncharacterized protein n=1 Tax=Hibiscus sabdariffa TaxID=183260 RepID=A0ABR2DY76_9ROSI
MLVCSSTETLCAPHHHHHGNFSIAKTTQTLSLRPVSFSPMQSHLLLKGYGYGYGVELYPTDKLAGLFARVGDLPPIPIQEGDGELQGLHGLVLPHCL